MKVRLSDITERPSQFSFKIERKDLQELEERYEFSCLNCKAELHRSHDFIELRGSYRVSLTVPCDLCLERVSIDLENDFRLDLVSEGNLPVSEGDVEITMDSPEIDFYCGEELILRQYFEDQLILDLPLTISCKDDCKGLCSVCGANLNQQDCGCRETKGTNPFSVLKDFKPDIGS